MAGKATRRGFIHGTLGTASLAACGPELADTASSPAGGAPEPSARVQVSTKVNGKAQRVEVDPDATTLELVRDVLGLTGSKLACGHGACGACAVKLDGTPVKACLLPATSVHGRTLTTIEGLATRKRLHPVQRAFMAEDALQCGYCTSGFVVAASAFYDRWRKDHGKDHGTKTPDRDTIAAALAGHLCRCAAYEQIYAAVARACSGDFDAGPEPSAPRKEARDKVTGRARYTVDVVHEGMLHAKALHSPHAHAVVRRIDWSEALAQPGVRAAVALTEAGQMVRFAGQEIVALAAVDEATAERALAKVEVEYDVRDPVLDPEAARKPDAPLVYPGRSRRRPTNASEAPLIPMPWSGNVRGPLKILSKKPGVARRRIAKARKDGHVVEGTWIAATQSHTTFEPHAAVARWDGDSVLVHVSTQAVRHIAEDIAERWGLRREDVRVVAEHIGGGFGSKASMTQEVVIPIELARAAGAPVRYVQDRRVEMALGGNRPGCSLELALAADRSGEMRGLLSTVHSAPGSAVGSAVAVLHRLIYPKAPRELVDYDVVTHTPPGKPFRAPGGPQATWALEQAIDQLAHDMKMDPVELRRPWDPNPARTALYDWVQALPAWASRAGPQADRGRYRRGIGLASGAWFCFQEPKSKVQIDAGPDGIRATQSSQDMGNGTRSIIAKTIAEAFGMSMNEIDVDIGDSRFVHGPMAAGSRSTASVVPATVDAVEQVQKALTKAAARRLSLKGARPEPGGVAHDGGRIPWTDVLAASEPVSAVGRRKRDRGGNALPPIDGTAMERAMSGSVQVVSVEVDTRLGRVRVLEAWGGFGVGKIVAPQLARSLASGGILQGISYVLYEQMLLDPRRGDVLTAGLEDYRIMGLGDAPKVHVHFDEGGYEKIRGHSVGLAELVTVAAPAAVGNAVFDATGWRPYEMPLTPARVREGVAR